MEREAQTQKHRNTEFAWLVGIRTVEKSQLWDPRLASSEKPTCNAGHPRASQNWDFRRILTFPGTSENVHCVYSVNANDEVHADHPLLLGSLELLCMVGRGVCRSIPCNSSSEDQWASLVDGGHFTCFITTCSWELRTSIGEEFLEASSSPDQVCAVFCCFNKSQNEESYLWSPLSPPSESSKLGGFLRTPDPSSIFYFLIPDVQRWHCMENSHMHPREVYWAFTTQQTPC